MTSSASTSRSRKDVPVRREHPLRSSGGCFSMPRGTCGQLVRGLDIRRRWSSLLAFWPWWNGSCVVCGRRGTVPLAWHHSSGAPLHKSNKPGPKGRRVVHVLPSTGKQFFKALMRRKPNGGGWSQPEPADWLHGHIPGKRRESAVLIRQVPDAAAGATWAQYHWCIWIGQVGGEGTGQWRHCWGRMVSSGSRDTGWRPQRFQEEAATSQSRLVRAG